MRMDDYIVRAMAGDGQIRAYAMTSRGIVEEARRIHGTSPVMTAALGRLLSGGAMMGAMMKGEEDLLTIQASCEGPAKALTVTADSRGNVKGYPAVPDVMLPPNEKGKLDVGGALGPGILRVVKDMGLKEPYVGQTELQTSEIAEDLTYYFAVSEQTPSAVGLGVLMNRDNTVRRSGGFIVQLMPSAEESAIEELEQRVSVIHSVTDLLEDGMTPEEILGQVAGGLGLEILDRIPARYYCGCSRERVSRAISSIGAKDLDEMIRDGEPVEVGCQFCGRRYVFTTTDLEEIRDERRNH